jgi:hypothetical protein
MRERSQTWCVARSQAPTRQRLLRRRRTWHERDA